MADVDRTLGNEDAAVEGFREGIKLLESLTLKPEETALEQRVRYKLPSVNSVTFFSPLRRLNYRTPDMIPTMQRASVLEFLSSQLPEK